MDTCWLAYKADTSRSRGSPKQLRRLHLKGRAALDTHSPSLNPTTSVKVFNTRPPYVRVRLREVDAAPRCAGRPRIAGSAFERVGLERARSREARRPHRSIRRGTSPSYSASGYWTARRPTRTGDMIDTREAAGHATRGIEGATSVIMRVESRDLTQE